MGKALIGLTISIFLAVVCLYLPQGIGIVVSPIILGAGIIIYKIDRLEYLIKEMKSGSDDGKTK